MNANDAVEFAELIEKMNSENDTDKPENDTFGFEVRLTFPDGDTFAYNRILTRYCLSTSKFFKFFFDDAQYSLEDAVEKHDSG